MKRTELEQEIKEVIVSALDLEDIRTEDIVTDVPLFGEGLGLDSIDALEMGMAIRKKFQVTFQADPKKNKAIFYSVKTLADFIIESKNLTVE